MYSLEIDPLADVVPPRHAYESDDEDEFDPTSNHLSSKRNNESNVKKDHDKVSIDVHPQHLLSGKQLIVAIGDAGLAWGNGMNLGDEAGRISVNGELVSLVFKPSWTSSNVIVADFTADLEASAAYAFGHAVTGQWRPESVVILDRYDAANYRSEDRRFGNDDPIRCMCLGLECKLDDTLSPFSPPNLLQGPIAALINVLSLPSQNVHPSRKIKVVLLPSPGIVHIKHRTPRASWDASTLKSASVAFWSSLLPEVQVPEWTSREGDDKFKSFDERKTARSKEESKFDTFMYM